MTPCPQRFLLLILGTVMSVGAQQYIYNPLTREFDRTAPGNVHVSGSGVPSNPCPVAGQFFINATTAYFCGTAGGSWIQLGSGTPAPGTPGYSATVTSQTTLSVSAATHGQGLNPIVACRDNSTPNVFKECTNTTVDTSGNIVFTWSPAFSGTVVILGASGGFANPMNAADQYIGSNGSSSGVAGIGQLIACGDSTHTCKYDTGTHTWSSVAISASGAPTGPAGGVLSGTYPNPTIGGLTSCVVLSTPAAPSVAVSGTTGASTYSYRIAARNQCGSTLVSTSGTVTTGNAVRTGSNFNTITVPSGVTGVLSYDIYLDSNSVGVSNGYFGNVAPGATLNDTGILSGGPEPTGNTTAGFFSSVAFNTGTQTITNTTSTIGVGAGTAAQGPGNTIFGYLAGSSLTAPANGANPQANTFIGYQACPNATTARELVCIGYNAGAAYIGTGTGVEDGTSVFIGSYAGAATVNVQNNTYIGQKAGLAATGANNVAIGTHTYTIGVSGDNNTIVGTRAVDHATGSFTGNSNTVMGYQALSGLPTTDSANVVIGSGAAINQAGANNNTIVGATAGVNNTSGGNNTLVGQGIMSSATVGVASGTYTSGITATGTINQTCALTTFNGGSSTTATVALTGTNTIAGGTALVITAVGTGYTAAPTSATAGNGTATCSGTATVATILTGVNVSNAIFGQAAGAAQSAGSFNAFFGASAGAANTIGSRNTLIGYNAGNAETVAVDNTLVGYETGQVLTGGTNVAIGSGALIVGTTATGTVAIGYNAAHAMTTASGNTIIGNTAGASVTTSSAETFVGNAAGNLSTGSKNTFLGYRTAVNQTTGSQNTAVGDENAATLTTGSSNTVIGWTANVSAAAASFQTVIGAAAVGAGDNTVTLGRTADAVVIPGTALSFTAVAGGVVFKSGSNARIGTGTLSGGTLAVANTSITVNSMVFVQDTGGGVVANIGALYIASQTAGTGFTVTSSNAIDTSTFRYWIIETQ